MREYHIRSLEPVEGSRAYYGHLLGVEAKKGTIFGQSKYFLVSAIGIDGKIKEHYTRITAEQAQRYNSEQLGEMEQFLFNVLIFEDLIKKYPSKEDRVYGNVFHGKEGRYKIKYTVYRVREAIPGAFK